MLLIFGLWASDLWPAPCCVSKEAELHCVPFISQPWHHLCVAWPCHLGVFRLYSSLAFEQRVETPWWGSVSEQTIWTMREEKTYFTSAWFPWHPGKIALELWGAILPGSPSTERKIKVALIVVGCFIVSDSTGLACQDLGEGRIIKCFEEPYICIFACVGSLLHMWPGRCVPLGKATEVFMLFIKIVCWPGSQLNWRKVDTGPGTSTGQLKCWAFNSIFCTSRSTFVSPVDTSLKFQSEVNGSYSMTFFFSFPTVLERLIASCASCFSGYFDVLIFLAYIHL